MVTKVSERSLEGQNPSFSLQGHAFPKQIKIVWECLNDFDNYDSTIFLEGTKAVNQSKAERGRPKADRAKRLNFLLNKSGAITQPPCSTALILSLKRWPCGLTVCLRPSIFIASFVRIFAERHQAVFLIGMWIAVTAIWINLLLLGFKITHQTEEDGHIAAEVTNQLTPSPRLQGFNI